MKATCLIRKMMVIIMAILLTAGMAGCAKNDDTAYESAEPETPETSDPVPEYEPDELDNKEFGRHIFMDGYNYGASGKLTGNIELILVFINDSSSTWTEGSKREFSNAVFRDCESLKEQAGRWGASLNLDVACFDVSVPQESESRWYEYLMENFFMMTDHDMVALQEYYEDKFGYDDTPLLFIFNSEGRSRTYQGTRYSNYKNEYSIYYAKSMGTEMSITHELLHIYGAYDYYYPEAAKAAATKYFPDSSMLTGGREIDDATAYVIGWTDYLTDTARAFLNETFAITHEMVQEGLDNTWEEWS